jgi:hypothetical protein
MPMPPSDAMEEKYAKELQQEMAAVEAEAAAGGGETFPAEVTVESEYLARCIAKDQSIGSQDLAAHGKFTVAPNGLDLSVNIGAFTTGNIPYPIAQELKHAGPKELGLESLQSLHFHLRIINDLPTGEGEVQLFMNALGTNIPQICIKDKLSTIIMMAQQGWASAPDGQKEMIERDVKDFQREMEFKKRNMDQMAQSISVWPDYDYDSVKVCGVFGPHGPCVSMKGSEGRPEKISVAAQDGICGLYFRNWNEDPAELGKVGAGLLVGESPICENPVTIADFVSMNAPKETLDTLGMSAKLATGAHRLFTIAKSPQVHKLFAKAPAASMLSQIYGFTGGILVASLVGFLVVQRKNAVVQPLDEESLTARPMLE